jgi:hypothetical protein
MISRASSSATSCGGRPESRASCNTSRVRSWMRPMRAMTPAESISLSRSAATAMIPPALTT